MDYNYAGRMGDNMQQPCKNCRRYPWETPVPPYYAMPQRHVGMMQPAPSVMPAARPDMAVPVPYYMAHPYPVSMQEAEEDDRDMERIVSMFPKTARYVQPIIEDECDRMEYDGSLMFDEYPDKVMMERLVDSIYQRLQNADVTEEAVEEKEVFATGCRNCGGHPDDGLKDLISVMLFGEMHRRRCRHRRCKRWW